MLRTHEITENKIGILFMSKFKQILLTIWIFIWSVPLNLFAVIMSIGLLIIGCKPSLWGPAVHFTWGHNWGGLEMGLCCFITDDKPTYHTKCHEVGHLLQQAIFGPFMPFLVSLPSASRYWLYEFKTQHSRRVYVVLLGLILLVVTISILVIGLMHTATWLIILAILLTIYVLVLCGWLWFIEIPKFKNGKRPAYDSAWFEKDASNRGTNFIKKFYPNII